jgi:hypothetical protein
MVEVAAKNCQHGRPPSLTCPHCSGLAQGQNPRLQRVPNSRFFGPVDDATAAGIVELMLDSSKSLEDTLTRFARGDIDPRMMSEEIQIMMESEDERIRNSAKEQADEDAYSSFEPECGAV